MEIWWLSRTRGVDRMLNWDPDWINNICSITPWDGGWMRTISGSHSLSIVFVSRWGRNMGAIKDWIRGLMYHRGVVVSLFISPFGWHSRYVGIHNRSVSTVVKCWWWWGRRRSVCEVNFLIKWRSRWDLNGLVGLVDFWSDFLRFLPDFCRIFTFLDNNHFHHHHASHTPPQSPTIPISTAPQTTPTSTRFIIN